MRYMLMRMADPVTEASELPGQDVLEAMADYNNRMLEAGGFVTGDGLRPSREGCRIERRDGQVRVTHGPFGATFWAQGFGMFTDRFGVPWMIGCQTGQCPMSEEESQP